MKKKDIEWCEKNNIWLEPEDKRYDGYWYMGGYEYQYQYTHYDENGYPELECVTTSPYLVGKYRSKSLPLMIKKIFELNGKNGHRSDGEGASGVRWGFCNEEQAKESDYFPKDFIELIDYDSDTFMEGFY